MRAGTLKLAFQKVLLMFISEAEKARTKALNEERAKKAKADRIKRAEKKQLDKENKEKKIAAAEALQLVREEEEKEQEKRRKEMAGEHDADAGGPASARSNSVPQLNRGFMFGSTGGGGGVIYSSNKSKSSGKGGGAPTKPGEYVRGDERGADDQDSGGGAQKVSATPAITLKRPFG